MASPQKPAPLSGVLVIDKPSGPTSHDVVGKLRRTLRMRRIGHAGTLDPMASGVLVVLLGEATKLGPYLTAHDKRYEARIVLGMATDTFDALGEVVTATAPIPAWLRDEEERGVRVRAALEAEQKRTKQTPPAFSAIKVGGQKSYDRARRGEEVELEPRPISIHALELKGAGLLSPAELGFVEVSLDVSKGFYVRSFARDLGETLGMPAHLDMLRRTQSGPFSLLESRPLMATRDELAACLIPLAEAAKRAMSWGVLTAEGVVRASQGKRLTSQDFSEPPPAQDEPSAWLSPNGRLVAVGISEHDRFVVQRGFTDEETDDTAAEDEPRRV